MWNPEWVISLSIGTLKQSNRMNEEVLSYYSNKLSCPTNHNNIVFVTDGISVHDNLPRTCIGCLQMASIFFLIIYHA